MEGGHSKQVRAPRMGRDSAWLAGADIVAVFLALFGQVVLTRALWTESYGLFIIALDVFATLFLVIDLGLPTLLARDGANAPHRIWPSIVRIYNLQIRAAIPFLFVSLIVVASVESLSSHLPLVFLCATIALVHIATYAPRSGLRAAGEARLEAWTKVLERGITTLAYVALYGLGITSVAGYASAFLLGAVCGLVFALFWVKRTVSGFQKTGRLGDMGEVWASNRTLLVQALPFAITLGVLPYVVRVEKFIVSIELGLDSAALFHVAQLAWLAGLVIPQAMRAALLPVLGKVRHSKQEFTQNMNASLDVCMGLLPVGIFSGAAIVGLFLPIAFPEQYVNGSMGASAVDLFTVLLLGWCFTVLSTPTYTALQAGMHPWRFTIFIVIVVAFSAAIGLWLIGWQSTFGLTEGLFAAACASSLSAFFALVTSIHLSASWQYVFERSKEWVIAITGSSLACVGLLLESWLVFGGLVLIPFIPQALEAVRSNAQENTLERILEAE
ncbi:MAG: hypothetical protein CL988_06830 [Euryarchaeota archaeon]|nr:hypothetical protein [Euryarchaeota archaeon]